MNSNRPHFFDHMMGLRKRKMPKVEGDIKTLVDQSRSLIAENLNLVDGEILFFPNTLSATSYCIGKLSRDIGYIPHMTFSSHELQWNRIFSIDLSDSDRRREYDCTHSNYHPQKIKKLKEQFVHMSIDFDPVNYKKPHHKIDIYYCSHVSRIDGTFIMTPEKYQNIKKDYPECLVIVDGAQAVGPPQTGIEELCDVYIGVSSKFIGANPHIAFVWISPAIRERLGIGHVSIHLSQVNLWKPDFQWLVYQCRGIEKFWEKSAIADMRGAILRKLLQLGCVMTPNTADHIITYEAGHMTAHNIYRDFLRRKGIIVGTTIKNRENGNGWSFEDCYPENMIEEAYNRDDGVPPQRTPLIRIGLNHETTDEDVEALIKAL